MSFGSFLSKVGGAVATIGGAVTGNPGLAAAGLGMLSADEASSQAQKAAAQAAAAADPFAPYRSLFQQQLLSLYGIKPEFKFSKQAELDALLKQLSAPTKGTSSKSSLYSRTAKANSSIDDSQASLMAQLKALQDQMAAEKAAYDAAPAPSSMDYIKNLPGYQASLEGGMDAISRSASAKGMLHSGNLLLDLQKYGSDLASQTFNTESNRLMQLAGANANPANAAQYIAGGAPSAEYATAASALGQGNLMAELLKLGKTGSSTGGGVETNVGFTTDPYSITAADLNLSGI